MNEIGERFLPVGTVVMLKGGSKRVMIAGFCAMSEEAGEKVYDYSGCLYPEGFISSNQTCLFDHEQIEKVYFKGFVDEEEVGFKKKLNVLIKQINGVGVANDENISVDEEEVEEETEESDDDFIKNFPGPIDDVMKEINGTSESAETNLEEDEFIKNFPGPIDDVMKEINGSSESTETNLEDDEFIKNFPGPIDDVMREINEARQEPEIIEDIIDVEEPIGTSSNNSIEF